MQDTSTSQPPAPGWRKSSRSESGNCVEVGEDYRKSSRSVANGPCLEAGGAPGAVLVRDTTDRTGPVLAFPAGAWAAFTARTAGSGS